MSKGYIVIAQNSGTTNYLEQAYALALSLKLTQTSVSNLSVCVDEETKKLIMQKHRDMFDYIIDIPWVDAAETHTWKIHNKWKYYYMTPYDETVILDTDMIFPSDVSHWWDILSTRDVWATTNVRTFRGDLVTDDYYRSYFTANNLPNVYTAFFYFKKSDLATELFGMTEIVFQHWERFFYKYMKNGKPNWLSGDVAYALAIQILGIENECTCENIDAVPTFVHMKSYIQNVRGAKLDDDWTKSIRTYYNTHEDFTIGNFKQYLPFHYAEKSWLTSTMIQKMENNI